MNAGSINEVARSPSPRIAAVETFRLRLPYKRAVSFRQVTEDTAEYLLVRLRSEEGQEGLAECVCRPEFYGEDSSSIAYAVDKFFAPVLRGSNPLDHNAILIRMERVNGCRTAKSLVDVALWDLKGKVLGQPVWRLLGGDGARAAPLTWVAHGNSVESMVDDALAAGERGYAGVKLKTWRRSRDDLVVARKAREGLGKRLLYVDCNSTYTETEAGVLLPDLSAFDIAFLEDPCAAPSMTRLARLAARLPIAVLGDEFCDSLGAVYRHIEAGAIGGVSIKLRRTGITESLKIAALCEASGLPALIGTDSDTRLGAMARVHFWLGVNHLQVWPMETHFFEKLAGDAFEGVFRFENGALRALDEPGFGAGVSEEMLRQFRIS